MYDGFGEVLSDGTNGGINDSYQYDLDGRRIEQDVNGIGTGVVSATTYRYDPAGNLLDIIDPISNEMVAAGT